MFSVIIPLYNKSSYIEKCLLSVINQTFREFEVILVNDGSTDDGEEKVQHFIKSLNGEAGEQENEGTPERLPHAPCKISLINQPNMGVSIARNNGVKIAHYDYIAFLDADDWWESTYLEEMKSLIENYPDAGIYGCKYYLVKRGRKRVAPIGVEPSFTKGNINYCQVYAKNLCMPLWTGATVIHKSIFGSENGFKPVLTLGEDFDLWIRVSLKYPVAFLNKSLSYYNQDVELKGRAVSKFHKPENHFLWNLDYLALEEMKDLHLKKLLDNLRINGLFIYFLSGSYRKIALKELNKIDWTKQNLSVKILYNLPVPILKARNFYLRVGSYIKQNLLHLIYKFR